MSFTTRGQQVMSPLEIVNLTALMALTSGSPEINIRLIDGPFITERANLVGEGRTGRVGRERRWFESGTAGVARSDVANLSGNGATGELHAKATFASDHQFDLIAAIGFKLLR